MTHSAPFLSLPIPADHPALAGHFPGHPIVPGVVLLDEALLALAQAEGIQVQSLQIAVAKFLVPVRPGEALWLGHRCTAPGRHVLDIRVGPQAADSRMAATATVILGGLPVEGEG